jgi:radical SAM superfamily enzyme YgiQ (UPF0313 family)
MIERLLLIDVDITREEARLRPHIHHPLGLMHLAAACRERFPGLEVRIIHTTTCDDPQERILRTLDTFDPQLVGLRSLSIARSRFRETARAIRAHRPEVPLIGGGPYPSSSPGDLLPDGTLDLVVIGEGERTLTRLLEALNREGRLPADLPGTAVAASGALQVNDAAPLIEDLDRLPFPDYGLIRLADYQGYLNQAIEKSSECAFIYSTRGCPHRCYYCHNFFGKRVRRRSADDLVTEMRQLRDRLGVDRFVFVDDIFNVPMPAAKRTLRAIADRLPGVRLFFPNGLRADQLDDELLDLLEAAGTVMMSMAVETAVPRLQELVGKGLRLDRAHAAIEKASRRFILRIYFMVGFPTETWDEAMTTVRFAAGLDHLASPYLSVVRIYQGTSLYEMLRPDQRQARALAEQEQGEFVPFLHQEEAFYGDLFSREQVPLTGAEIRKLRWIWVRDVYSNPVRLARMITVLRKFVAEDQLLDYCRAMFENPNLTAAALERYAGLGEAERG